MTSFPSPTHTSHDGDLVHQLLRNLHQAAYLNKSIWATSCLVARKLRSQAHLGPPQAVYAVLTDILAHLTREAPLLADLLRGRFWDDLTVAQMLTSGRAEAQSNGRFYQQQRRALERFSALLHEEENLSAQSQHSTRLLRRLPISSYRHLFGFGAYIEQLHGYLLDRQRYPIVSIKGIGGIGKTSVADAVVRLVIDQDNTLYDVVWVSAKQEYLSDTGQLQHTDQTYVRLEQIFNELGYKLGVNEVLRLSLDQKFEKLASVLRTAPYLVVLDNLESIEDFRQLVPRLDKLTCPTQFLLTAHETIPALTTVTQFELDELDHDASIAFMNFIATEKGVYDFEPEAIFSLVGGNPLALILTVSQMQFVPAQQVLSGLRTGSIGELYTFIFWKAWSMLEPDAKEILFAIQRTGDVADWDWLAGSTQYSLARMYRSLQQLLDLSLVQPQQDEEGKHLYVIHRLTSTFLRTEVLGWK